MPVSATTALLKIQELDLEIHRSRQKLDELPEKFAILEVRAKIREMQELLTRGGAVRAKYEAQVKALQDETDTLNGRIAGEQTKLMETTDHRMVQAITREMDGFRRRIDKIDVDSLALMETVERADAKLAEIEAHLGKLKAKEERLIAEYRTAGGDIQTRIAEFTASRARFVDVAGTDLVERYESVRDAKGGIGIGRLEGTKCSSCHFDLPASKLSVLVAGPDVGSCPQCHRLIVVRGVDE